MGGNSVGVEEVVEAEEVVRTVLIADSVPADSGGFRDAKLMFRCSLLILSAVEGSLGRIVG